MDNTLEKIAAETTRFYHVHAVSFSSTRQAAWQGWNKVLDAVKTELHVPLCVLDIACGNFRFEHFLSDEHMPVREAWAVDNCAELLAADKPQQMKIHVIDTDIIQSLQHEATPLTFCESKPSLSVCFGFMHHVPSSELRMRLFDSLLKRTMRGGICAVSFWQFHNDFRLLEKAQHATPLAERRLEITLPSENDNFLAWQESDEAFRYCHSFTDEEVDLFRDVAKKAGHRIIADYCADGKSQRLNRYLVIKTEAEAL